MDERSDPWTRACPLRELERTDRKLIELPGGKILLLRSGDRFFACADQCPHLGVSLAPGELEGGAIRCRAHGYRMDLATGECLTEKGLRLPVFPVELRDDGWLWLRL